MTASDRKPRIEADGTIGRAYLQLFGIVAVWSGNWPFLKLAFADIGPLTFTALRFAGAAVVILLLLPKLAAPLLPARGERLPLAVVGFWQIAANLCLIALGLQFVPAGRAAVLAYTMQIWALPLGWIILGERLGALRTAGALLAFVGIVIYFNPLLVDWSDGRAVFGNAVLIVAAIGWALGACLYRLRSWRTPFWTQILWQLAVSTVAAAVVAFLAEADRPIRWTPLVLTMLAYNWLLGTALCYWWWAKALSVMPASQAGQVISLVPFAALLLSAALFGESLTPVGGLSVMLIGAGIYLTLRAQGGRAAKPAG
jgi:drug/metabolite transporter (DMT)-like permease